MPRNWHLPWLPSLWKPRSTESCEKDLSAPMVSPVSLARRVHELNRSPGAVEWFGPTWHHSSIQALADYAVTAPMEMFVVIKHDRRSTEFARLQGAQFVTATETETGQQ